MARVSARASFLFIIMWLVSGGVPPLGSGTISAMLLSDTKASVLLMPAWTEKDFYTK